MKQPDCLLLICLIALLEASCGVRADTNELQESAPHRNSGTNLPRSALSWKQIQNECYLAEEVYEKMLQSYPAVQKARADADLAKKDSDATQARESAAARKEVEILRARYEGFVGAYLATNADYLKIKTSTNNLWEFQWTSVDSKRLQELREIVAKLKTQSTRSIKEEEDLREAREELVPLAKRENAAFSERLRGPKELVTFQKEAEQRPERQELGRQFMERQMKMWNDNAENKRVQSARENAWEKKKIFEEQIAQHPELLQAKRRLDEAKRAKGQPVWLHEK